MARIRVLAVDDSPVVRRVLTMGLSADADLEIVGTAADGQLGLAKIMQVNPDVVILDIEMPVMNGLETLKAIRKVHPRLPVIMFSTLTARGAAATLDALSLGASDYLAKPTNLTSPEAVIQHIREELAPKIKRLCQRPAHSRGAAPAPPAAGSLLASRAAVSVLAIGVSTGGPNALAVLLPLLATRFRVPVVLVQHMPPLFTKSLADRITSFSAFRAHEGEPGALLQPGDLWVAPGGQHMEIERTLHGAKIRLHDGPPECSCRPAVDVLFRSVARVFGPGVLGLVLTGMGQDGRRGSQSVCEAGGRVLVQDEASSVVWGMPGAVFGAGLADKALNLPQLAEEINRRVGSGALRPETRQPICAS